MEKGRKAMHSDDSMGISEALRTAADDIEGYAGAAVGRSNGDVSLGCIRYFDSDGYLYGIFTSNWFRDLADRIDDEMVELPRDKEGKPIHPGDIEYLIASGDICEIYTIEINGGGAYVTAMVGGGTDHADVMDLDPRKLTHTMPDSLERIVGDIANFGINANIDNPTREFLVKIQGRICQIAKENGHVS